jgi:hypothetical protein
MTSPLGGSTNFDHLKKKLIQKFLISSTKNVNKLQLKSISPPPLLTQGLSFSLIICWEDKLFSQTYRQADRQTDRQTGRETDKKIDRKIDR